MRALVQVVDLKFGNTANFPRYAEETGRPPVEPPLMFKKRCLQFLDHLSERQAMAAVIDNLLSRGVLGLAANERPPAPTAMGHVYSRL